jgi:hypothetical protein
MSVQEFEIDGYAVSVILSTEGVSCSAFKDRVLFSAMWARDTMRHCAQFENSKPLERLMPEGLMAAFEKTRDLALADADEIPTPD